VNNRESVSLAPQPAADVLVLPAPPRDNEKYRYVRNHGWVLTVLTVASFPLLLFSQLRMLLHYHWLLLYSPVLLVAVLFFAMPLVTEGFGGGFDFGAHRRLVAAWHPVTYPSVDVFLPVCGEPVEVLRNTWENVMRLRSHYRGIVTPYVLDDSASPQIHSLAAEFGFSYFARPNRGWYKKSGNLLYGFQRSSGDFILLLDADFAPRQDILDETLPYMDAYPDTGIVQTPQFFRIADRQTWVERGAGAVQELFYRNIQTARAYRNGAICVGSCAIYRRRALDDNHGMTLAEHSEDVLTGFDLSRLGWRLRYVPVVLSTGNCPDNIRSYFNQQYRWCSGTLILLSSRDFWTADIPVFTRLCYLSGFVYYLYTGLFTFALPALSIGVLAFAPELVLLRNMSFMVPALLYSAVILPWWHHAPYRLEAWACRAIASWAHVFAHWDQLRRREMPWKPSGTNGKGKDGSVRFWYGFVWWTATSSVLWTGLAFWRMLTMSPANFAVLFALGAIEVSIVVRVLLQPAAR
jgi:cellulose synthase (UDP-forming)